MERRTVTPQPATLIFQSSWLHSITLTRERESRDEIRVISCKNKRESHTLNPLVIPLFTDYRFPMPLYVVLHHRDDQEQPWVNAWLDETAIEAIQTTKEIGQKCWKIKASRERVFVHRCGHGEHPPVICCSVNVAEVSAIDNSTVLVTFSNPVPVNKEPPLSPVKHQNFYEYPK